MHMKRQPIGPGMSAMAGSNPLLSISLAMKATIQLKRCNFATSRVALSFRRIELCHGVSAALLLIAIFRLGVRSPVSTAPTERHGRA